MILPKDWRRKAVRLTPDKPAFTFFKGLGRGIWIDDDCPLMGTIVVVLKKRILRIS